MNQPTVLSRHRLPRFYRIGLVGLWLTPGVLFLLALIVSRGFSASLLDPRLWVPLLLMSLPALYFWREGVDVLTEGIRVHIQWTRYYSYEELDTWSFNPRSEYRTLTIRSHNQHKVLEYQAAQLSDWPVLLRALQEHLRQE